MSMFTAEYQDFKREDPTVLVKVTLYDDQKNVIKPVISKAKLVQGTKYAGDYKITQDGDQYCLSTKQIAKLPSGSYGMELWGDDGSIYPSAGFIPIRIHRNADDSLEKTKPTIDLDSIIEDLHKAGLNVVFDKIEMLDSNQSASVTSSVRDGKNHITLKIPRGIKGDTGATGPQGPKGDKGDKGDTGTVDNAGLTTAPAFVNLQTQVNNSAVGTNLLTNSNFSSGLGHWSINSGSNSDCKAVATTDSDGDACIHITGTGVACGLYCNPAVFNQNQITTGSVLAKGTGALMIVGLEGRPNSNFGTISTNSYSKISSTMQAVSTTNFFCVYFAPVNGVIDVYIKLAKLELGSHATDWRPNPTEIMTQSDYAKIQAAIVALGGSLK